MSRDEGQPRTRSLFTRFDQGVTNYAGKPRSGRGSKMDALVAAEQAGTKREADEDVVALEHEAVLSAMLPAAEEEARPIRPRQIGVDVVAPKASAVFRC